MKIAFFGDGPWAHDALIDLLKFTHHDIAFVCGRFKSLDNKLYEISRKNNLRFFSIPNVNTNEFTKFIRDMNVDLLVSMSFNQIFKKSILESTKKGAINCHAGALPFYRGRNVLNWVLINGENEFGITVHFIDEGIDTGDIILQEKFRISDEDNYESLLKIAYRECPKILLSAINLISSGDIKSVKQNDIDKYGSYCVQRLPGDEVINWNQSSTEIFNFVRGLCKPGPMAKTHIDKVPVFINKAETNPLFPIYKGIPGSVVGITDKQNLVVKTLDSVIVVTQYFCDMPIKIGSRLG
jgi:methionyl-tRNA formyltransferase